MILTVPHDHELYPTLGPEVCAWIEQNLVFGPGDLRGQPAIIDDEKRGLIYRMYEVYPKHHQHAGRRRFKRAGISLSKGQAKTELGAWLVACELHPEAPVRCTGWRKKGKGWEPVGGPVTDPYIPMVAYTEEQSDELAYGALRFMLSQGPLKNDFDIGIERIMRIGGDGKAESLAASPSSRDGARTTFTLMDEPLALDTPVPTPTGWTTMGQIRPGDQVFGAAGQVCNVVGISPIREQRDCYRLTFADGTHVVADSGHTWYVHRRGGCGHGQGCRCETSQGWQKRKTADLLDVRQASSSGQSTGYTYHVPRTAPVELPAQDLPIDPYVLGLWLGDGDSTNATISAGARDVDEIEAAIVASGYVVTRCTTRTGFAPLLYVTGRGTPQNCSLIGELRELGLLRNKHIPAMYLRASVAQRLALLQGLMDADGHATTNGYCTFVNTSRPVVDGIAEVLRSLGYPPRIRWRDDNRKASYKAVAKVEFQGDLVAFGLERKRVRLRTRRDSGERAIVSVEPVASVPVRCIAVDSPDHLFLAGRGMVATHNTHWMTSPRLRQAHQTMLNNLAKRKLADPWMLEITTAPEPGVGSLAEATMMYAKAVEEGQVSDSSLFYFHRQASDEHDLTTPEGARAAVIEASGPSAAWRDIDAIVRLLDDPETDRAYWERVWCNRLVQGSLQAFNVPKWEALARPTASGEVEAGRTIVLGFDGAVVRDSTGLVATDVATGYQWLAGAWERPPQRRPEPGQPQTDRWEVPAAEVDMCVRDLFTRFNVWRLYADPPYWQAWIAKWIGEFGAECVIEWWTNRNKAMTAALESFDSAINGGLLTHDGDARMKRHLGNARRHDLPQKDEDGKPLWLIRKERADSPNKIDFAMAAVLSWEARTDAIAAGVDNSGPSPYDQPSQVWY